ncbi:MAG TPA: alpha/beta hydrolase [Bryobacteraceae bacterium]|nr:alpha/beta hydrolase [Bryobacteraceae bacterium]
MKLFRVVACVTVLVGGAICFAEPKTEIGEINGAKFRIDVPDNWNGGLVLYCHGYSPVPGVFKEGKLPPTFAVFTDQGYALAQSGYAAGGWAVQEAVTDTENLRRYFLGKYGKPKETYVTGHSMGGFLTMLMIEQYPSNYDGGLALCGPLAPATYFMGRGAFDLRVVFDYFFPGALPPPNKVDANYQSNKEAQEKLTALLDANPEKSAALRRYSGAKNNKDLGFTLSFVTYMLKELQARTGGNPFDNRGIIYEGVDDYNALNDGVKRYAGDEKAAEYVRTWYTPTGRLERPLLAIHTTYDQLVPVRIPDMYPQIVDRAGSTSMFVQQYVKHDGHCAILPAEIQRGFSELREWKSSGVRPPFGLNHETGESAQNQ